MQICRDRVKPDENDCSFESFRLGLKVSQTKAGDIEYNIEMLAALCRSEKTNKAEHLRRPIWTALN